MSWITERDIDWDTLAEEETKAAGLEPPAGSGGGVGGRLPPIMSCMTINPRALKGVREMNSATTFGSPVLTRVQEEAIATTVSVANECRY